MTTYACPRHPTVAVTMNIPARTFCVRCGKPLRAVEGPADPQPSLFNLEEKRRVL
jgi:hypothetical protein